MTFLIPALLLVALSSSQQAASCHFHADELGERLGHALLHEFGRESSALWLDSYPSFRPGQDSLALRAISLGAARAASIPLLVAPASRGGSGASTDRLRAVALSFDRRLTVIACEEDLPRATVRVEVRTGRDPDASRRDHAEWLLVLRREADEWTVSRFYQERIY